jgi:hypothetical protein
MLILISLMVRVRDMHTVERHVEIGRPRLLNTPPFLFGRMG